MNIKKGNMAERALQASAQSPTIADRLAMASSLSSSNPVVSQPQSASTSMASAPNQIAGQAETIPFDKKGKGEERLETIDLDKIEPNPYNARQVYRQKRILELAASIGVSGQDTPGIATIRNGKYVLVAGHYRYRALKHLNNKPMTLIIRENLSDKQMYEMSFRENNQREDETALDNALSWKDLLEKKVYANEKEISEVTGYSWPVINKIMAILGLDEQVLAIIREDPAQFKYSVLYELKLYSEAATIEETIQMTKGILDGSVSRKTIEEARAKIEKPGTPRKRKETARSYKINRGGRDVGSLKTFDSGKVAFVITIDDSSERQQFISELKAKFQLGD